MDPRSTFLFLIQACAWVKCRVFSGYTTTKLLAVKGLHIEMDVCVLWVKIPIPCKLYSKCSFLLSIANFYDSVYSKTSAAGCLWGVAGFEESLYHVVCTVFCHSPNLEGCIVTGMDSFERNITNHGSLRLPPAFGFLDKTRKFGIIRRTRELEIAILRWWDYKRCKKM